MRAAGKGEIHRIKDGGLFEAVTLPDHTGFFKLAGSSPSWSGVPDRTP
jgi:hypothetical protein